MPFLNRTYESYKEKGLELISLSVTADPDDIKTFRDEYGMKYPAFLASDDLMEAYGLEYIPFMIILDRKGEEQYRKVGHSEETEKEVEELVNKLLKG